MHLPTRSSAESRRRAIFSVVLFYCMTLALVVWITTAHAADDDWEAVGDSTVATAPAEAPVRNANASATAHPGDAADIRNKPFNICGEEATPASPQVAAMVARINQLWGSDFHAYQTVAYEQPHASTGGCVFYNAA